MALEKPLATFRNVVAVKRNQELPPDQQRPLIRMFTALLPIGVWAELEELLDDMQYMEGLRDGDETWSQRQKAVHALIEAGRNYYAAELEEARQYKAALEGMESSPAAEAQEQQDR